MKILHILKSEIGDSEKIIIEEHKKDNDVEIINLRENKNYDLILELIEISDKVFCW